MGSEERNNLLRISQLVSDDTTIQTPSLEILSLMFWFPLAPSASPATCLQREDWEGKVVFPHFSHFLGSVKSATPTEMSMSGRDGCRAHTLSFCFRRQVQRSHPCREDCELRCGWELGSYIPDWDFKSIYSTWKMNTGCVCVCVCCGTAFRSYPTMTSKQLITCNFGGNYSLILQTCWTGNYSKPQRVWIICRLSGKKYSLSP